MYDIRFYRNDLPKVGEIVMCEIYEVGDMGSYCTLLQYGDCKGMIGITEYSRLRIRNITKIVNVGKILPAQVTAVDCRSRCIDLSKKVLHESDIKICWDRFEKQKQVYTVARKLAQKVGVDKLYDIYSQMLWDITYEDLKALQIDHLATHPWYNDLLTICKSYFASKPTTTVGSATIVCYGPEGIDGVKTVLSKVKDMYPQIKINYSSAGLFSFTTTVSTDREVNECMETAIQLIKQIEGGDGLIEKPAVKKEQECTVINIETDEETTEDE